MGNSDKDPVARYLERIPSGGSQVSSKDKIEIRRRRAFELRMDGYTYQEIGDSLGVSNNTAYTDVKAVLEEMREHRLDDVEQYVRMEMAKIDSMEGDAVAILEKLAPKLIEGDVEATKAATRLIEQRRKLRESFRNLLGLDSAKAIEITARVSREDRREELEKMFGSEIFDVTEASGNGGNSGDGE